jgi:hypothetical protein
MNNQSHAAPALTAQTESANPIEATNPACGQLAHGEPGVKEQAASAHVQTPVKRGRQTNHAFDSIWTRRHAICTMGALCDIIRGGCEAAHGNLANETPIVWLRGVPAALKAVSPWLIDAVYLNLEGSSDLAKMGLDRCFESWAANRICYFYRYPHESEHPAYRKRGNLRLVYREFYEAFSEDLSANREISEDRARAFWLSVSDRVPFQAPPKREAVALDQEVAQ